MHPHPVFFRGIKQYTLLFSFFFCVVTCGAQSNIHGLVADASGNPLAGANVLLLNVKDSSLVKGVISSHSGSFSIMHSSTGQLLVSVTFTGYQPVYIPASANQSKSDIDLGTVKLSIAGKELKTVVVATKKPMFEQRIDRMVINVKNSITSAGSTALDVLERSPGVLVDRQNSNISIGGKDGVVVMINGKINHMPMSALVQMLAGMNSANIEKIEDRKSVV